MTEQTHTAEEGIEGIDGDEDSSLGEYPIDTVLIRTETRTVHDVLRRIDSDQFILNPDFQRDFIWTDAKQSKLIESVLMRIPLPVFYLAENEEGNMIVVDGLQRISTFQRYVNNSHPLRLPHQKELNKKKFSQLSPKLQNRIEDCNLILYVIDAKVPEQARLDIFERVNSGVPLTRQQMRNSIYMGEATRFLRAESITDIFTKATGSSLNPRTMRDREFINRFCSFKLLPINDYKGDMDDWLATSLETMNKFSKNELNLLSKKFQLSLKNNFELFKDHAFRKHIPDQTHRSLVNASLWDVMSVGLSEIPETTIKARKKEIKKMFFSMLEEEDFDRSITYGTNQVKRVKQRFTRANEMFREVFGDK